jgi:hypothetical protein
VLLQEGGLACTSDEASKRRWSEAPFLEALGESWNCAVIDWTKYTAEEIVAIVQSAPPVMGPWLSGDLVEWYRQSQPGFPYHFTTVQASTVEGQWITGSLGSFCTADEAKAAVDAELTRRGWKLMG